MGEESKKRQDGKRGSTKTIWSKHEMSKSGGERRGSVLEIN